MFLSPGAKLDKYEIVAPLAVGGMAELYIARATGPQGFEKLCVVKRILTQHARDEEFVKMFLDEARLAATLRHPNVIQVYDVGSVKGRYYFAMEYVHGQDLASIVSTARANRRGLRVGNALAITAGAAAGLHHAHEQLGPDGAPLHIVHRDVSPANILVSYDGHVKVVDFGIAKAAARATRTTAAGFKGKLCYMSPEQVQARPDLDRRSDVFSLGVVLYELTTGKPLFRGDSDLLIAEKIVAGDFARPRLARDGYDPRLEEIVMTALALEPAKRFSTALAMQLAVEDYARAAQLQLTNHALGDFMRELFAHRIESWELAKKQGRSLAEFVRSTAELSALNVTDVGVTPPAVRPWWKKPSALVGGAAIALAITGWGIVLARNTSSAGPAPQAKGGPAPQAKVDPAGDRAKVDFAKGDPPKVSPAANIGSDSIPGAQVNPAKVDAANIGSDSISRAQVNPATNNGSDSISRAQVEAANSMPGAQVEAAKTGSDSISRAQAGSISRAQVDPVKRDKHRRTKRDKAGTDKAGTDKAGTDKAGTDKPKSLDETVNPFDVVPKKQQP